MRQISERRGKLELRISPELKATMRPPAIRTA
jgi:hypothetical protein